MTFSIHVMSRTDRCFVVCCDSTSWLCQGSAVFIHNGIGAACGGCHSNLTASNPHVATEVVSHDNAGTLCQTVTDSNLPAPLRLKSASVLTECACIGMTDRKASVCP